MSQQKSPLIVQISSGLSTAIFDCRIYSSQFIYCQLSSSTWWNFTAA